MNYQLYSNEQVPAIFIKEEIIGLDLDDETGLRLVSLECSGNGTTHSLVDHRRFQTPEQLKSYWAKHIKPEARVAISLQTADPLQVVLWLMERGACIDRHNHPQWKWTRLGLKEEFSMWTPGLPRTYAHAYTLAFLSVYRLQAATVAGQLSTQAATLRMMMTEFETELKKLRDALPDPREFAILYVKAMGEIPF